jgi:hypothetical protein
MPGVLHFVVWPIVAVGAYYSLHGGFDIPRGQMREDALDWVKEHEDRRERRHGIRMVATIAAAVGAWLAALILLLGRL